MKSVFVLLVGALALAGAAMTYHGHKVVRVAVPNEAMAAKIQQFESQLDFWTDIMIGRYVDIRLAPEEFHVMETLRAQGFEFNIMIQDVQVLIDATSVNKETKAFSLTDYNRLADIHQWLDDLAAANPGTVETEVIGTSVEGRDQKIIKICQGGCGNKPIMWIQAGIHAREWISPAVACYMIDQLVNNAGDAANAQVLESLDWYFLPSVNPDGYEFTFTDQRLWRKNRRVPDSGLCYGVDLNRNWGPHWDVGGSSDSSCSDTYHGPSEFSEPESDNIRRYLADKNVVFFHDQHSYSQLVLIPWGWRPASQPCDDYEEYPVLKARADQANEALLAVHGKDYTVGCISKTIYQASGGSIDWAQEEPANGGGGVPNCVSMELRDTGAYGFLLPPDQIIPNGEEVWAFHLSMANQILGNE